MSVMFRRGQSKVWYHSFYDQEDENISPNQFSVPPITVNSNNWNRSGSNRSSGSPSDTSQKSQDSGFSDSDSGSPSRLKTDLVSQLELLNKTDSEQTLNEEVENESESHDYRGIIGYPLPPTPMRKIPRANLTRKKAKKCKTRDANDNNTNIKEHFSNYLKEYNLPINTIQNDIPNSNNNMKIDERTHLISREENYIEKNAISGIRIRNCLVVENSGQNFLSRTDVLNDSYEIDSSNLRTFSKPEMELNKSVINDNNSKVMETPDKVEYKLSISKTFQEPKLRTDFNRIIFNDPTHTSTPKKCSENSVWDSHVQLIPKRWIDPPVLYWLRELHLRYDAESITTLQSKPVPGMEKNIDRFSLPFDTQSVTKLQQEIKQIFDLFVSVYKQFKQVLSPSPREINRIAQKISIFLIKYANILPPIRFQEALHVLLESCEKVQKDFDSETTSFDDIKMLGRTFASMVDSMLRFQVLDTLAIMKNKELDDTAVLSMKCLIGRIPYVSKLLCEYDGIPALVSSSVSSSSSSNRCNCLRILAIVCSNTEAIQQLEDANGISALSDILSDLTRPEEELLEAVSVLVEITAPWAEENASFDQINKYLDSIVRALTCFVTITNSNETLLLTSAALTNLSFMDVSVIWALMKANAAKIVLTAVRLLGCRASVFLQEQVATLLANMASMPEAKPHLAEKGAAVALLCFLQIRPSYLQSPAEVDAVARLQHKSAMALSRLCSDAQVCKQIIQLKGIDRLVKLCKDETERNDSDAILVACLTSLRKIASNCGDISMDESDIKQLIEPKLVDSFLLYSSKKESLV